MVLSTLCIFLPKGLWSIVLYFWALGILQPFSTIFGIQTRSNDDTFSKTGTTSHTLLSVSGTFGTRLLFVTSVTILHGPRVCLSWSLILRLVSFETGTLPQEKIHKSNHDKWLTLILLITLYTYLSNFLDLHHYGFPYVPVVINKYFLSFYVFLVFYLIIVIAYKLRQFYS